MPNRPVPVVTAVVLTVPTISNLAAGIGGQAERLPDRLGALGQRVGAALVVTLVGCTAEAQSMTVAKKS
jgi:hypothetical protein